MFVMEKKTACLVFLYEILREIAIFVKCFKSANTCKIVGNYCTFNESTVQKTSYIKFFFFLELLVSSAAYLCLGPEGVFVGFSNFRHSVGLLVHRALHEGNDNLYDCGNIWHNKKTQWDPTSRNVCQHHLPKLNPACIFVTTCYFSHYLLNGWKFKPLASL